MHSFDSKPNMANTLTQWSSPYVKKTVTIITDNDFNEVESVERDDIFAIIQPAQKEKLNLESLDWSKEYVMIHTSNQLDMNEYVEYKGRDFKIVDRGDYTDYGYIELVGEETKKALL